MMKFSWIIVVVGRNFQQEKFESKYFDLMRRVNGNFMMKFLVNWFEEMRE
jgi:disulfide oxidoreductase YuzD